MKTAIRIGLRISVLLSGKRYEGVIDEITRIYEPKLAERDYIYGFTIATNIPYPNHRIFLFGDTAFDVVEDKHMCRECGLPIGVKIGKWPHGRDKYRDGSENKDGSWICVFCEHGEEGHNGPTDDELVYVFGDMSYGHGD